MSSDLPLTGFGVDPELPTFARFHIDADAASGVYPDWEQQPIMTNRHIPGSNRTDTFFSGFGVATVDLKVSFDNRAAFMALRSLYLSTGILRLLASFTSQGGPVSHILGSDYEDFDNTTLIRIGPVLHQVDEDIETVLTFSRGFDPVTGSAVI